MVSIGRWLICYTIAIIEKDPNSKIRRLVSEGIGGQARPTAGDGTSAARTFRTTQPKARGPRPRRGGPRRTSAAVRVRARAGPFMLAPIRASDMPGAGGCLMAGTWKRRAPAPGDLGPDGPLFRVFAGIPRRQDRNAFRNVRYLPGRNCAGFEDFLRIMKARKNQYWNLEPIFEID